MVEWSFGMKKVKNRLSTGNKNIKEKIKQTPSNFIWLSHCKAFNSVYRFSDTVYINFRMFKTNGKYYDSLYRKAQIRLLLYYAVGTVSIIRVTCYHKNEQITCSQRLA